MTDAAPPTGVPLAAFVEGLLDGRVADGNLLVTATAALGQAGAGAFRCDIQGGRFTLLPLETRIAGGFDTAAQARFLQALEQVLAGAQPGTVEGNLRCRLVHADEVTETLFVVRGDRLEPLTRRRPRTPADAVDTLPREPQLPLGLRLREVAWAAPILLLVGLVFAWQSGWIDRVLAARAEALRVDAGPFGSMLATTVERSWGNYEVSLRRGADYPATPQAVEERQKLQTEHAERTALGIVGDGRDLFVQLLGGEQQVLAEGRADVRPLLAAADATVVVKLPGRMGATGLRLSIVQAPRPK